MSLKASKIAAKLVTGSTKQTDGNAAAPASKTKPTMGALGALVGSALVAVAHASNVHKTPMPALNVAGVMKTETSKGDEEKKESMLERAKRRSGLFGRKSTDEASPPSAVEALTAALSNLTVHADNGEANKHHQRQFSTKCEPTEENGDEQSTEESDDEHSPILGGPDVNHDLIHVPGPMKGAQRNTRSQSTLHPPTDEEAQSKKGRGDKGARIASHHPSEPAPAKKDMASFQEQLDSLPGYLQKVVLSYGGNTHNSMLEVMLLIEQNHSEEFPLLRVVHKDTEDYKHKEDGKPHKTRRNRGIKSVFCRLCHDERDYKTIGHAAAHLTEAHWGLKPWRCFTCERSFPHPDKRMSEHTNVCSPTPAQSNAPIRLGQSSDFAHMYDSIVNGSAGGGVYQGTDTVPSSQTPPDSAADPSHLGHAMFVAQPPSNYQQHPYVHQTGSTFNHTPSPNHSEPSDIHRHPSSSPNVHYLPSHSQNAYIQSTSRPYTYGQQPSLSLDPRYSQTNDYSHGSFAASPSSYGAPSPVRSSPTETRPNQWHQCTNVTHLPFDSSSTSIWHHASTANTRQPVPAGPTHNYNVTYDLGSSALAPTLLSMRAPVSSSYTEWYQQMSPAAPQPDQVQRTDPVGQSYVTNVTYQQVQQRRQPQTAYIAPPSAAYDRNYALQDNSRVQPNPSHTLSYALLVPSVPTHFWRDHPDAPQ